MARKNVQVERLDKLTPRDYQHEAIVEMRENTSVLLADDLGLGKTLMIVERCRTIKPLKGGLRILYIAPNNTHLQIKKTFLRQFRTLPEDKVRLVGPHGPSGTKYDAETWRRMTRKESGIFIIGPEAMAGRLGYEVTAAGTRRKIKPTVANLLIAMRDGRIPPWHQTGTWDLLVFDEVHRSRNRKDALIGKTLRRIKAENKIGASATPGGNKEEDIWYILEWLWREQYSSFWRWAGKHFKIEQEQHGWDRSTNSPKMHDVIGEIIDPKALWDEIPCAIRRLARDVLDLPPVITHEIEVGMTPVQREAYDDFEIQCFAWLDGVPVGTPLPIVKQIRLRQLALGEIRGEENLMTLAEAARRQKVTLESLEKRIADGEHVDLSKLDVEYVDMVHPKIEALKDLLTDLPEGEPVLVLTHSSKYADLVAKKLGKQAKRWPRSDKPELQEEVKAGFGRDYQYLVAVISGVGTGTDGLQERGHIEVWLSQDQDGVQNEQAQGRLDRSGQTQPVQRYYIRTSGTIDDDVYAKQLQRGDKMSALYGDHQTPGPEAR